MSETRAQEIGLDALLNGIENGQVVLPDFQRDFDWTDREVRALLATVLMGWPIGSLMLIEGSHNRQYYSPRAFEKAPPIAEDIVYIVLDGQQRLTSLYHALRAKGDLRYFLEIDFDADYHDVSVIDDLVTSVVENKWTHLSNPDDQWNSRLIPFTALESPDKFYDWRDSCGANKEDRAKLTALFRERFNHLSRFRLPAVVVDSRINPSAIARVFQRVNQGGAKLGAFDLMVAKTYSNDFNLRTEWSEALQRHPILAGHTGDEGLPVLSVLAMKYSRDVRQSAVLNLPESLVRDNWGNAVIHFARAVEFVERELGVLDSGWLPYKQMLTVIAAVDYSCGLDERKGLLKEWFWKTGFEHRYDSASNTRAVADYRRLEAGDPAEPGPLKLVGEELLAATRARRGAMHRAYLCALGLDISTYSASPRGEISPTSVFRRLSGDEESVHLRTLSFVLRDEKGGTLGTLGMQVIERSQFEEAAWNQIHQLSEFLTRVSGTEAVVVTQADQRALDKGA